MPLRFQIETEQEDDGRSIAEAIGLPGVLAYGQDEDEAICKVEALALRVIGDQVESEQIPSRGISLLFVA